MAVYEPPEELDEPDEAPDDEPEDDEPELLAAELEEPDEPDELDELELLPHADTPIAATTQHAANAP